VDLHGEAPGFDAMLGARLSRQRADRVRHNRRVNRDRYRRSILAIAFVMVAGCGRAPESPSHAGDRLDAPDAELAWQGVLACADCDGIDTRLRLQHGNGVVAQYQLVEAFRVGQGAEYFQESGRWRRDGRLLRLTPSQGGERLYVVDGAGNLVVVDHRGHAAGAGRVLSPVQPAGL
jgi:hypothetical protein